MNHSSYRFIRNYPPSELPEYNALLGLDCGSHDRDRESVLLQPFLDERITIDYEHEIEETVSYSSQLDAEIVIGLPLSNDTADTAYVYLRKGEYTFWIVSSHECEIELCSNDATPFAVPGLIAIDKPRNLLDLIVIAHEVSHIRDPILIREYDLLITILRTFRNIVIGRLDSLLVEGDLLDRLYDNTRESDRLNFVELLKFLDTPVNGYFFRMMYLIEWNASKSALGIMSNILKFANIERLQAEAIYTRARLIQTVNYNDFCREISKLEGHSLMEFLISRKQTYDRGARWIPRLEWRKFRNRCSQTVPPQHGKLEFIKDSKRIVLKRMRRDKT